MRTARRKCLLREPQRCWRVGDRGQHERFHGRTETAETHAMVTAPRPLGGLVEIGAPVDVLAVHVGPLAPEVRLKRALQDRRPRQIALVVLDRLVGPVEVGKVALVVAPLVPSRRGRAARRRSRDRLAAGLARARRGRTARAAARLCRRPWGRRGRELGGEKPTARDPLRRLEPRSEVGEIAGLVEGNPPGSRPRSDKAGTASSTRRRRTRSCGSGTRRRP